MKIFLLGLFIGIIIGVISTIIISVGMVNRNTIKMKTKK